MISADEKTGVSVETPVFDRFNRLPGDSQTKEPCCFQDGGLCFGV